MTEPLGYEDCDNCGSDEWDNGVCSLDGLGFCCEECLDSYLNGGQGILSANPQDRYDPEPYRTSFYTYENGQYKVKKGPCDRCGRNLCGKDECLCPECKSKGSGEGKS